MVGLQPAQAITEDRASKPDEACTQGQSFWDMQCHAALQVRIHFSRPLGLPFHWYFLPVVQALEQAQREESDAKERLGSDDLLNVQEEVQNKAQVPLKPLHLFPISDDYIFGMPDRCKGDPSMLALQVFCEAAAAAARVGNAVAALARAEFHRRHNHTSDAM